MDTKRTEDILKITIVIVALVFINIISSRYFVRIDLTEEKRFSIKEVTKNLLLNLDEEVHIEVFLEGELNADFQRLQRGIREVLEEFVVNSNNKVKFSFVDPMEAMDQKSKNEFISVLSAKGIIPTQVYSNKEGVRTQKLILPGALVSYGQGETGVMLLKGNRASTAREKINQSIEGIEFELASAILQLSGLERKKIGLLKGHGELDSLEIIGLKSILYQHYNVEDYIINGAFGNDNFDLIIIAKPTKSFSEVDKFYLDQYIMQGGKVLFLIDQLEVNMDSIQLEFNYAFPYKLNIDDMLFRYGVRINSDLVQDLLATQYPVVVGNMGDQPQIQMISWPFFPLISKYGGHFSVKNLDAIAAKFVSTMDTVKAVGVNKTPLLFTSKYSRNVSSPVNVSLNELKNELSRDKFNRQYLPLGYLLEGNFKSLFRNRILPKGINYKNRIEESTPTKLIVISDGDIAKNNVNPQTGEPLELGYDGYARMTFANQDFLLNIVSYLIDGQGLISVRAKEVKIRPLDTIESKENRTYWQVINLVLPIAFLLLFGMVKYLLRKRRYSNF